MTDDTPILKLDDCDTAEAVEATPAAARVTITDD